MPKPGEKRTTGYVVAVSFGGEEEEDEEQTRRRSDSKDPFGNPYSLKAAS